MKFIKSLLCVFLLCSSSIIDRSECTPGFSLIHRFADRLKANQKIILFSYGVHTSGIDRPNHIQEHISDISTDYKVYRTQSDVVSVDEARCMILSISESFLKELNADEKLKKEFDEYPFPSNRLDISISFRDDNDIGLGNGGVRVIYLSNNKIRYKRYEITEYKVPIPIATTYPLYEESYAEALTIVKQQGCLKEF